MSGDEFTEIACTLKSVTEKAVLIFDGKNDFWVPQSLLDDFDADGAEIGKHYNLSVKTWFCIKEGLV